MRKLSIAIFAERLYGGGVERILQIILRNLDYRKYDIYLYSHHYEIFDSSLYPTHLKYRTYFKSYRNNSNIVNKLLCMVSNKIRLLVFYHFAPSFFYRLFIHKKFDITIAFIEGYATRIASGASSKTKKIAWLHTDIINYHWTKVAYRSIEEEKNCYKKFSDIVCVAQSVKKQADIYFQTSNSTKVIYNPIDRDKLIRLSNENIRVFENLKRHKLQLLIVGTLNENKGQLRLLHILAKMIKKNQDVGLWIVGDGEYRDIIKETISNLGLEYYVEMFGYQSNPYPFFKQCDIYVCASFAEGFNTAITEALVLGIPVVATLCSGVIEQLGHNCEYGIIADNNEVSLHECIEKMLNPQTLKHYQQKSVERGRDFCITNSMEKIESLLQI